MRLPMIALFFGLLSAAARAAPAPHVLVSIKPLHSIVAAVMNGAGAPELLLTGAASPHSYALKPSDARKIARAEVIFWTGPVLETFLVTPLTNLAPRARIVALGDAQGVTRLPARKGGVWEADEDDDHAGGIDGHVWLDPRNAIAMADTVARTLAVADPSHAALFAANSDSFAQRVMRLDAQLARSLAPVRATPYLLFHDAFHYFEARYGLSPMGAVTVAADRPPGVRRVEMLRARIKAAGPICVFSTPQFSPRLLPALTEGSAAKSAVLDDLGADIPPGPGLYEALLTRIAGSLRSCLTP
ncbi:MAG TPA: zinc ABC transporter substrate-binding protein [Micropepsaceae bacterium]|nr:zinc ABC transporter substrate-binding protein [Micropepsaceae bacterium]